MSTPTPQPPDEPKSRAWSLWLFVIIAFALSLGAWTTFILLARQHPVETVPLDASEQTQE